MRPPLIDMILSQIIMWCVFTKACLLANKFYKSVDGRLRILCIQLFSSIAWLFGISAIYWLLWDTGYFTDVPLIWLRIIGNLPMFLIMFKFDSYINHKL